MTQGFLSTDRLQTTPARLRTWSVVLSALLALSALLGVLAARSLDDSASEIRDNIGPVLIETQGLVASIAEADAANTSVFLSGIDGGVEDRQQRALYENALERAPRQIESISARLAIDSPSHAPLQAAGSQLTEYAGTVERARVRNSEGLDAATDDLREALLLAGDSGGMLDNVGLVNAQNQARLEVGVETSVAVIAIASVVMVITILGLLIAQFRLRKLTKRSLNPGLLMATGLAIAALVWLTWSSATMVTDLQAAANDGYDSIELIGELQTAAFAFRTNEALAIIGTDAFSQSDRNDATAEVGDLIGAIGLAADTDRERSAVELLATRWERYRSTSNVIALSLSQGQVDGARTLAIEGSNEDFNGFNTTLEAVLLGNRDQFDLGVQSANDRLRWLGLAMVILPLLGVAFVLAGYQPRINEYW